MNLRLILPFFLACISVSLFAQPEIVSITYEGNVAILTRNEPAAPMIYYWQGASCGTLMNHSGSTTLASSDGTYYLREYNSSSSTWASSCASTIVLFPDVTAPVLSDVTPGPIEAGTDINATSNEDGMIYLVPVGTGTTVGEIEAAKVAEATAVAGVASTLATDGLPEGDYIVYAVDGSDNVSAASPAITISWATYIDLNNADMNRVQLYPVNVTNVLHIRSNVQVTAVRIYSLQGSQVIHIAEPVDQVDMGHLNPGVYIVRVQLEDDQIFSGKINKR
jgi:hypothetical protein